MTEHGPKGGDEINLNNLFIVLKKPKTLHEILSLKLKKAIRQNASPRHVPKKIIEVSDIPRTKNGKIEGVETSKGFIRANKIGVVASGHTSVLAETAGIRLPLQSKPLQALVSEPIKPIINTVVMSSAVHAYVSQSDKGELVIGAGTDSYNSFTQRGGFNIIEETIRAMVELYPVFGKMKMLRQWGGIVDICPDASPIISKTNIKGLYFNCGWGTGGLKATPGSGDLFAHTIANDEPHKLNAAFNLNRFVSGDLVDEHGAAAVAH